MAELLKICEQGNVQQLQEFIVKYPIDVKVASDKDRLCAALHVAAANGHDHAVAFLLGLGADVNGSNSYGWTPLMQAARHGHTAAVLLLLSQGSQPDAKNRFGATAFTCAVRSGHVATVRAILNCGFRWTESEDPPDGPPVELTAMMVAANLGHDPILRLLLDYGFDVNQSSHTIGMTPLIMAAANGRTRTTQILIERGADVTAMTRGGRTALDVAIACKRRQVRCILEQKIAEIKLRESVQKKFDIFEAIQCGRLEEVQTAVSKDRKLVTKCRSIDGLTPLMFATQVGDSTLIELLVIAGAELDSTDTASGWTALMFALFHGQNEIALQLMQAGASVNVRAHGGFVAFDIATTIGTVKPELITLLARETEDRFLHPLANIVRHDEPDAKSSMLGKSKNIRESLGKTLAHLWPTKFRRRTKCGTEDVTSVRPLGAASSMPLMLVRNLDTREPVKRAAFFEPDFPVSSFGTDGWITLPIVSASPCRWAVSKSPVRPVPPLLPSQSFDASVASGNINMSLNLPVSHSVIGANGNKFVDKRLDTENAIEDRVSKETCTSGEDLMDAFYAVLKKHSLEQWKSVFDEEEVDLEAFKLLTEVDLVNLGVQETSARNSLLRVITELNR